MLENMKLPCRGRTSHLRSGWVVGWKPIKGTDFEGKAWIGSRLTRNSRCDPPTLKYTTLGRFRELQCGVFCLKKTDVL